MNLGAIKVALAALGIKTGSAAWPTPAQINALGVPLAWNASTNTPALVSSTAATADNAFVVTVAGTTTLDGISTWAINDIAYFDGAHWQKIAASTGIVSTSAMLKGDGAGGAAAAVAGVDYVVPGLQWGVPIGVAPTGTVGSNGAVTMGTAFIETYTNGLWLYYPANSITGANAAGFYWTVMSSTTVGTIYNTVYTPGTNTGAGSFAVPSSPTPFSGTTGGAFSNATNTNIPAIRLVVAGNSLGPNGNVKTRIAFRNNNTANTKTCLTTFGGTGIGFNAGVTTTLLNGQRSTFWNAGKTNVQAGYTNDTQNTSGAPQSAAIDTTVNQNLDVNLKLVTAATDWIVMLSGELAVSYAA